LVVRQCQGPEGEKWLLADIVLLPAGATAIHGVRWFPSRPPVVGLEYEMDLRGVVREVLL